MRILLVASALLLSGAAWAQAITPTQPAARSASPASGPSGSLPVLTADTQFPAIDETFTVTLSGTPGANFGYLLSFAPAELPLGSKGTLFVDPAAFFLVFSGVIPVGGSFDLPAPLPNDPLLVDAFLFVQGATKGAEGLRFSNGLAFRIEDAAPSEPRRPVAIAVTGDGSQAFVAQQGDGALTVLDALTDARVADLPVGRTPVDVAVDPDDRHVFAVNTDSEFLTVLDAASLSTVAHVPVPFGCRRVAFDFALSPPRVYVTNLRDDVVLVFEESPPGVFSPLPSIPLTGHGAGALDVLDDGRLVVGFDNTHTLEILDPSLLPGNPSVAVIPVEGLPFDVLADGGQVLVASFEFPAVGARTNRVAVVDLGTFAVSSEVFVNTGTDYVDLAVSGGHLAVVGAGSGTVVMADRTTLALTDVVELAPSQPNATPERAAFVPSPGGPAEKLYVVNHFRESVRAVDLTAGPPFALGAEIPLAHDSQVKVPLIDLSPEEDGRWFFRSVEFMNGTALNPNKFSCASCHPDGGSNNATLAKQILPMWFAGHTGPWGATGQKPVFENVIIGPFNSHSQFGGTPPAGSVALIEQYLTNGNPSPRSPHLLAGDALSAEAQAGKVLFEGVAGCVACHAEPFFIPLPPAPPTIAAGVGTSLVPANVTTLKGVWKTAPYLADGSADTLLDVLLDNVADQHGTTSTLTAQERDQLVAYVKTL
jgi:YVTN family beta-propeller protein